MREYDFHSIEPKWQDIWEAEKAYRTEENSVKPKLFCLDYFPYPSGDGLHVGHCRNYIPTDVISRFYRMKGFNVLHPMGWDAFGLPAENEAIRLKKNPREITIKNTTNFKRQLKLIGTSYDWEREINSSDPEYYRWTQWFFLLLYKRGLAYEKESEQWWCPSCRTVLANEQAKDGKCWRCGTPVEKKKLKQWFFRITDYADRLADDLDTVDWPERIKIMQRNWIGKSVGAEVVFDIVSASDGSKHPVTVFTTRLDTIMGATFLVLAPEHPLIHEIVASTQHAEIDTYVAASKTKTEIDRMTTDREKTGVFTGAYAVNPFSGEKVPVWIADYVLMGYGTGAIMAVPAHDSRDFAFATRYGIPIRQVIGWPDVAYEGAAWNDAYSEHGALVNSGRFDGLTTEDAFAALVAEGEARGFARAQTNYHMRDWLISRQRYWGAPIPMITARSAEQSPFLRISFQCYCRMYRHTNQVVRASHLWPTSRNGSKRHALCAEDQPDARRIPWTASPVLRGMSCGIPALTTTRRLSTGRPWTTGFLSTFTSVAPNTQLCICCIPGFGPRSCTTRAWSGSRSRSLAS